MTQKTRKVNPSRHIEQTVKSDSQARNSLAVSSSNYERTKSKKDSRSPSKLKAKGGSIKKVKKPRTYTEKELGIPKLNKSIDPEGVKPPRGKKGKKFPDNDAISRIVLSVTQESDNRNASKLEKARLLEEVRESKRKEMESRERDKDDKLSKKMKEIKHGKPKSKVKEETEGRKTKRVSFA